MMSTVRFVEEGLTAIIRSVWSVIPVQRVSSALMALKDLSTIPAQRAPTVPLGQQWRNLVLLVSTVTVPKQQQPLIASPVQRTHSIIYSIKQLAFHVEAAHFLREARSCVPVVVRTDIFK